jgi:ABC-type Fe3+ transport system substrate-binding protein
MIARRSFLQGLILTAAGAAKAAPAGDMALYPGPDRAQRLEAAARREGKVVFYSGMIENQALRPIADAFRKKYPFIAVEYWRGDSRALVQKALSERRADRVGGDVLESTGGAAALMRAGAVSPFHSPAMADYPDKYLDRNGFWAASRLDYFGLAYNTRQVAAAEAPKSYDDLLLPKWRGAIAWRADSEVGAPLFIAGIMRNLGKERGEAWLRKFAAQRVVNYAGSARALVDRVGAGEYKLAVEIYAHHPLISKAKGAPLDTVMLEPVPSAVSTIQLAKGAPHPNAALLLIDFVLSREGQEVLRAADYFSANPRVDTNPLLRRIVPGLNGMKEIVFTPEAMFDGRDEANALFDRYFRQ